ncbi:pantoate--beta-alanine ligase [Rhizobium sp. Root274]|uniref:pantoate--beta-alanine ligase n=1 Tax=unclassified Rhizobium TaxID=2613769 RepID=UPI0007126427|nr:MULTISPECIES: pantoate--beta-alanine ligase [unclassified Rhizobium]KQW28819.1 pantoate--beta-alanine ligase [Rhizobium sp. Root1240]KRD29015.1 pantoate--beta-alanine ligase [Rhizobium sp. Root274]
MDIITTIAALREKLAARRRSGQSIGFVPTMGYLHQGHLSLVSRSKAENDATVVSIFVNPLQFGKNEDLEKYPRDLDRDAALLRDAGVDFLFAPSVTEMYPEPMQTVVDLPKLGSELEGEARPGHFAGVATVVSKLFNIVQPDAAYFGEKDYQQVTIIQKMVEDLAQPVRIVPVSTVREADGLACSSRNVYLSPAERAAAVIVPKTLAEAERLLLTGIRNVATLEEKLLEFLRTEPLAEPEVVAIRDPQTLERIETVNRNALVLLYVRFGKTKLLDNRIIGQAAATGMEAA